MSADHELVASPRMSFSRAKHAKGGYPTKIAGDPGGHPRNRAESGTRSGIDDRKQCPCHGPIAEMRRSRFVLQRRFRLAPEHPLGDFPWRQGITILWRKRSEERRVGKECVRTC